MSTTLTDSTRKAQRFRSLHHADRLLILPNAWDVVTARVFESCGFPAVGTTSFGIARANGLRDGENASLECCLAAARLMAPALSVPLSADIEAGYSDTPAGVEKIGRQFVDAGVVGFNIEDGQAGPALADVGLQSAKIAALKEAGREAGVPVFVNARTDVFWLGVGPVADRIGKTLRRAEAYAKAGADGIFVPGLAAPDEIASVVRGIALPLNVLASQRTPPVTDLAALGVRRLSLGSGPIRATLGLLRRIGCELLDRGSCGFLDEAIPYEEANQL